jgi:hypothetical protein
MDDSAPAQEKATAETSKPASNPSAAAQGKRGEVVVNVRFQPNGLVSMINHKPEGISDQEWFDRLCRVASGHFMALSGGRGAFCIPGDTFQLIWEANS